MANVLGKSAAVGKVYNVQGSQSITFQGLGTLAASAMGMDPNDVDFKFYDSSDFDFGKLKPFPLREHHFFCSVDQAKVTRP